MRYAAIIVFLAATLLPTTGFAQGQLVTDTITFAKARVTSVSEEKTDVLPGTDTPHPTQRLAALILDGAETGKTVTFENDYTQLAAGELFFLRHTANPLDNTDSYSVADPYRLNVLGMLAGAFVILLFLFGGWQGVRGLASLSGSFVLIFWVLIPGILHGYSPVLVSIGVSSLIIIVGSYITHGFTRTTSAAVFGMIATVLITGLAAFWAVYAAHLSGFTSEENVYLNFNTNGSINMVGLLFGGIMIGLLGVLYDIAIGQAVAVEELFRAGGHLSRREIYLRAIRIGREHIGALVNTLAIAYAGAALPLLLLVISSSSAGLLFALNSELFSTEIVRILVGSMGLVLGVPVTTLIASYLLSERYAQAQTGEAHAHHH